MLWSVTYDCGGGDGKLPLVSTKRSPIDSTKVSCAIRSAGAQAAKIAAMPTKIAAPMSAITSGQPLLAASTPAVAADKRDPNSNELIKAAVAAFERSGDGSILAMRERFARAEPTECVQRSLASLREVSAIVDVKAPDEAAAFKTWLREISQKVAEAAVEGSFLGFGGVRVSDAEAATLRDISKALGLSS